MLSIPYKTIINKEAELRIPNSLSKYSQSKSVYISPCFFKQSLLITIPEEFCEVVDKMKMVIPEDKDIRTIQRAFYSITCLAELSSNNLVTIPIKLKNYAKLQTKVILVESNYGLEVWGEDLYEPSYSNRISNRFTHRF